MFFLCKLSAIYCLHYRIQITDADDIIVFSFILYYHIIPPRYYVYVKRKSIINDDTIITTPSLLPPSGVNHVDSDVDVVGLLQALIAHATALSLCSWKLFTITS